MKKNLVLAIVLTMSMGMTSTALANNVTGSSLEDVINGRVEQQINQAEQPVVTQQIVDTTGNTVVQQEAPVQNQVQNQVSGQQVVQDTINNVQNQVQNLKGDEKEFFNTLNGLSDMSNYENETVKKAGSSLSKLVGMAVQFLGYVITAGIVLRVVIDLAYIALPFMRGLFSAGNNLGNRQQGQQPGAIGGNNYNNMNYNRYNGLGNSLGNNLNGYNQYNTDNGQQNGVQNSGGFSLVSNAALNAVKNEGQIDTNTGKPMSPFKIYSKDMTIVLVLTPILFVLAVSGALTGIGFTIGEIVSNVIGSFAG